MEKIEFGKHVEIARFLDPRRNFEEVEERIEIRIDPLTGLRSRVISKPLPISKDPEFMEEVERQREWCPFCPERIEEAVTKDPILPDGRLRKGDAIIFPNISPYAKYSMVVVLSKDHFVPIDGFRKELLLDGLILSREYLSRVLERDDNVRFASINMSYLKSAGSSLVHPHMQLLIGEVPSRYHEILIERSRKYKEERGSDYWQDLIDLEKRDCERLIGETKKTTWIAPFAPRGFLNILGICEERNILLSTDQLEGIAQGLERILRAYAELGFNAFNFTIFLPERGEDSIPAIVDVVARSPFDKFYWCEVFFIQYLHEDRLVDKAPEIYAEEIRRRFRTT